MSPVDALKGPVDPLKGPVDPLKGAVDVQCPKFSVPGWCRLPGRPVFSSEDSALPGPGIFSSRNSVQAF